MRRDPLTDYVVSVAESCKSSVFHLQTRVPVHISVVQLQLTAALTLKESKQSTDRYKDTLFSSSHHFSLVVWYAREQLHREGTELCLNVGGLIDYSGDARQLEKKHFANELLIGKLLFAQIQMNNVT